MQRKVKSHIKFAVQCMHLLYTHKLVLFYKYSIKLNKVIDLITLSKEVSVLQLHILHHKFCLY